MKGNLSFKIDWVSLIVESKFTVFALSYSVFEGNSLRTSPGGLYLEVRFNRGFFMLPVWRAYIWRCLSIKGLIFRILWYVTSIFLTVMQRNEQSSQAISLCCVVNLSFLPKHL